MLSVTFLKLKTEGSIVLVYQLGVPYAQKNTGIVSLTRLERSIPLKLIISMPSLWNFTFKKCLQLFSSVCCFGGWGWEVPSLNLIKSFKIRRRWVGKVWRWSCSSTSVLVSLRVVFLSPKIALMYLCRRHMDLYLPSLLLSQSRGLVGFSYSCGWVVLIFAS